MEKTGFEGVGGIMQQSVEQTRRAMESYLDLLQKNLKSSPGLDPELTNKMKNYTERNIAVASEFAQKLTKATDFQGFWRIQIEFMQAQWKAFNEQTMDLGETMGKGATGLLKGLKDSSF